MFDDIFFIPVHDARNKGDLAILIPEVDLFRKDFKTKRAYVPCLIESALVAAIGPRYGQETDEGEKIFYERG